MTSTYPADGARLAGRLADAEGLTPVTETTMSSDPQSVYRRLREEWGPVAPIELQPGLNAWLVMGYDEICTIARHERVFSHDPNNWRELAKGLVPADSPMLGLMMPADHLYAKDGEEHRRLRAPIDDAMAALQLNVVRRDSKKVCTQVIAGFASAGQADLVQDYTVVAPMLCLTTMFGFSIDVGRQIGQMVIDMVTDVPEAATAQQRMGQLLMDHIKSRRENPAGDTASLLLQHPNLRSDSEVLQELVISCQGAFDASRSWTAQTLQLMLTDPRFASRVRGGRLGVDDAMDEVLWRNPPIANMPARYALRDTELGGQKIEVGDALILGYAAANNDPDVHSESLWEEVGNRSHLAWSTGPHACPAQLPSRAVCRTVVETVLNVLPDIRLAIPPEEIVIYPSPWTRSATSLPVVFTPVDL